MIAGPGTSDQRHPDAPRQQLVRRTIAVAAIAAILGAVTAAGARATSTQSFPEIRAVGEPSTVTGTDGRRHLVYELGVENGTHSRVRLDRLDVVDPSRKGVVATYRGDAIKTITVDLDAARPTRTVPSRTGALILLDIALRPGAPVPARLEHRFRLSLSRPGTPARSVILTRAHTRVDRRAAVRISPPLRGPNLGVLGCCGTPFGHRLAALERTGRPVFPQRYAIDFLRLDDTLNTTSAIRPATRATSYSGPR